MLLTHDEENPLNPLAIRPDPNDRPGLSVTPDGTGQNSIGCASPEDGRIRIDVGLPAERLGLGIGLLSRKKVARATSYAHVIEVVMDHNLRSGAHAAHRCRSPIDPARTPLNQVLLGADTPEARVAEWQDAVDQFGIAFNRRDAALALEVVAAPAVGIDLDRFAVWVVEWLLERYPMVLSIDLHLDQARPHLHAVVMPVAWQDGRLTWIGSRITSGRFSIRETRRSFENAARQGLGWRSDRPQKKVGRKVDPFAASNSNFQVALVPNPVGRVPILLTLPVTS